MITIRHASTSTILTNGDYWAPTASPSGGYYRDTPAHTQQSLVAQIQTGTPWRQAVGELYQSTAPWLYRIITDPCRDLFFRENPVPDNSTILDIGAGWGQMSLPLARRNDVIALEPTPERLSFIRAAAQQEGLDQRMIFLQSSFMDIEFDPVFDLVCCIGVLEWVPKFCRGNARDLQREFLIRIRSVLKPQGKLVIGIENRLGLKYLLGSTDDHIGSPNISVLDAALANRRFLEATGTELRSYTYSLAEYKAILVESGFVRMTPYAAFPDYKVPSLIKKADETLEAELAQGALLPAEHDGCDGTLLPPLFQENLQSHYRSLAMNKVCRYFVPSYYLEVQA